MLRIPQSCIHTRSTPFWNKETAPAGIFQRHLDKGTRPGIYPRLSVSQGAVRYLGYADEFTQNRIANSLFTQATSVSSPERWHHIEVMSDDTLFNIDFFVEPDVLKSL
jgi:tellurite resistance-related uncharacterized protein